MISKLIYLFLGFVNGGNSWAFQRILEWIWINNNFYLWHLLFVIQPLTPFPLLEIFPNNTPWLICMASLSPPDKSWLISGVPVKHVLKVQINIKKS